MNNLLYRRTPWNDEELSSETALIKDNLAKVVIGVYDICTYRQIDRQIDEWIDRQKDEHSSKTALIKEILAKYETIKIGHSINYCMMFTVA